VHVAWQQQMLLDPDRPFALLWRLLPLLLKALMWQTSVEHAVQRHLVAPVMR
jgi:hypothetical protein